MSDSPNFHDHLPNESVVIPLNNPAGAKSLVLKFGMEKAANDWWWALDNIAVGTPPFASGIAADGVSFTVRIVEALGKGVDQTKGVAVELDGTAVTPIQLSQEGSYVLVKYSQTPKVFSPGSRHTVKVKYTSKEGNALEDTLEFIAPSYTSVTATPNSVTATITDTDWLTVAETKGIKLELDGTAVTPSSVTRTDTAVTARYSQTESFLPRSSHTLTVTFTTGAGAQVVDPVAFTAPDYVTVPASLGTAPGSAAQPGMRWRTHQLATARGTTIAEAEQQLSGKLGDNVADVSGQGPNGYFAIDYVNFEQAAAEAGHFKASGDAPENVDDLNIPGIPGTTSSDDNIAGEALTFIDFAQAGVYTMVVNSDDGFQVSAGTTNAPTQLILGKLDAGRGAADTEFYFKIDKAGVYFFRLLWFEGSGGASVEWFTVNADGSRALVGGTQPGALKAYRVRTVAEPTVPTGGVSSISASGTNVTINYTGVLKSAATITGPFQPVAGATSPYSTASTGAQQFFIAE